MKNPLKTLLPLAGLVLLASPILRAEDPAGPPPPPPGEHRERREDMRENAKRMAKELDLTAEQQIQAEAIVKQSGEAMKALHNDASLNEDQKRAKMKELRKSNESQIDALLTPEQKVKAKAMREKHGGHGPGDRPHKDKPPAPPAN